MQVFTLSADYSSEFSVDSPLYHEPSLNANEGKFSDENEPGEAEVSSSRPESGWGRGYLDPFGVLGKVFGRRSSAASQHEAPARTGKAVQALDFGSKQDTPAL